MCAVPPHHLLLPCADSVTCLCVYSWLTCLFIPEEFDLFGNVSRVVDLCAAPGSWSQVLSRVLIRGETFGRASFTDRAAELRRQMLAVTCPSAPCHDDDGGRDGPWLQKEPITEDQQQQQRSKPSNVKIVAVDLQPISPLEGIVTLRADITHPATVPRLLAALDIEQDSDSTTTTTTGAVDLVLSDGAPDVTGLHDLDIYVQSQLLFAALNLALCVLKPGGKFVAKIFRGRNVDVLYAQLKIFFERVVVAKPRSSRASSIEAFVVCLNFRPPVGFRASLEKPLGVGQRLDRLVKEREMQLPRVAECLLQNPQTGAWDCAQAPLASTDASGEMTEMDVYDDEAEVVADHEKSTRWIAPFVACGDLSAFDSDASYLLPEDYVSLDPVQPPIAPPYKRALELRAAQSKAVR